MKEDISLLPETMRLARRLQQNELTEYYIYTDLSNRVKDAENRKILAQIGMEERAHHFVWQSYTSAAIEPRRGKFSG